MLDERKDKKTSNQFNIYQNVYKIDDVAYTYSMEKIKGNKVLTILMILLP